MNETIETILKRRSIRQYKDVQISDEELNIILECGRYAPSGMNKQAYSFVAIQNEELMHKIVDACQNIRGIKSSPFYGAPTIILVFADKEIPTYIKDASAAIENMCLAAASIDVASCWINCTEDLFKTEIGNEIREIIDIPENYSCIGSVALGYLEGEYPEAKERKENLIKIIK